MEQQFVGTNHSVHARVLFQNLFLHHRRERRTDPSQPIIKNLALFAKQRFDSLAKPFARLAQHFDSALDMAADILRERGRASPEHVHATQLVDIMGSEAMLQMGMLADCAEACLELTWFWTRKLSTSVWYPPTPGSFQICLRVYVHTGWMHDFIRATPPKCCN